MNFTLPYLLSIITFLPLVGAFLVLVVPGDRAKKILALLQKDSRMPQLVNRLKHFRENGSLDPAVDLQSLAATITTVCFGLGFMQQVVLSEDPNYLEGIIDNIADTIVTGTADRHP